jgi:hypothetical protein
MAPASSCSPIAEIRNNNKNNASSPQPCLDYASLVLLSKLFNRRYPSSQPIRIYKTASAQFKAIGKVMKERYGCPVDDELCWMSKSSMVKQVVAETGSMKYFKPQKPVSWRKDPNAWLSNDDIEIVMQQYEEASQGKMKFVGVFPIDFASRKKNNMNQCISPEVCGVDVRSLVSRGVKYLAFVFNTDKHDQDGEHWISLFVGLDPREKRSFGVYFYDSVAKAPPKEVKKLMEWLAAQMNDVVVVKNNTTIPVRSNTVRRQYRNTECGMYSMLFLIRMVSTKKSFDTVCQSMGNDATVERYRNILYRL